ncbi:MAG: hypothetical protein M3158_09495 [Pseudomonadota bacterium]|jgi:hypothetical protein|nr:hypothetical protein [Pseudomonadota bacterium]
MLDLYGEALRALEDSGLGHLARHSPWTFTIANVLHVIGAALVLGGIAVFDIQVLLRRGWLAAQTGRVAIPLAAFGLALQIPTGLVLLAAEASALGRNPAFYAKLVFIALGLLNLALVHVRFRGALRMEVPDAARAFAAVSLLAWTATLVAGRMIAYL